jgi:hypothetical protein
MFFVIQLTQPLVQGKIYYILSNYFCLIAMYSSNPNIPPIIINSTNSRLPKYDPKPVDKNIPNKIENKICIMFTLSHLKYFSF